MQAEQVEQVARALRKVHYVNCCACSHEPSDSITERDRVAARAAIAALEATRASDQQVQVLREVLPKRIGRLMLGERLSKDHYCGGSHDMPDGHPVYWQERGGEHPDDIDGYCLACAIEQAESDAGWCDCAARAALQGTPNYD